MTEHGTPKGIDVTYTDGSSEHVDCQSWRLGDRVLYTKVRYVAPMALGYTVVEGPAFPLAGLRKWEETR